MPSHALLPQTVRPTPSILEIRCLDELDHCRLVWNSLLAQTPNPTFFHTLDWLETYWRHFGHDQQLRVLVASSGAGPIGILPLAVRPEHTRLGHVRVLGYPLSDWGSFYGPIGPNPEATLVAGLTHIRRTPRDWDLLDLRYVDAAGVDRGCTPDAMRCAGFHPHRQVWAQVALVDLHGTWETYWHSRTAKWRHNVERYERRLAKLGQVSHLRYRPKGDASADGDPRWELFDASIQLARQSWQGASTTGTTLCHESIQPFLRDVHAVAAALGNLDLNLLLVDDRPVAFAYNYHFRGWVSGLRMGFDPQFAADSPGTVLQAMILEDSFRRGDHTYDLGVGYLRCKDKWQTAIVNSDRYTHFPWFDARVSLLRAKRWLQNCLYGRDYVHCQLKDRPDRHTS